MKKFITLLMSVMMLMLLTACGSSDAANQSNTADTQNETVSKSNSKILVAYFSCTGNTKHLAESTATALSADIFEIKPKAPYTPEDLDWHNENSRSTIEMNDDNARPEIAETVSNFNQYETIIIAYPIWWSKAPKIIDTFVESYDFSGKTVIPICTSGGSEIGSSGSYLKTLTSSSVKWLDGQRFNTNVSVDELKDWFNGKF